MNSILKKQHYFDEQGRKWIFFNGKPSALVAFSHFNGTELQFDFDNSCAPRNLEYLAKWYKQTLLKSLQ